MVKIIKGDTMFYINLFFIFSIIGYFLESVTMYLLKIDYNSSVLYGPWTSIYGMAIFVMIIVYLIIKKFDLKNRKEKIFYFLAVAFVLTILEGASGYVIEFTQNKVYWNYDAFKFNIGHYMSLEIALLWGGLATFAMYYIVPKIKNFVNKIPKIVTYITIVLFIIDIVISFIL